MLYLRQFSETGYGLMFADVAFYLLVSRLPSTGDSLIVTGLCSYCLTSICHAHSTGVSSPEY